MGDSTVFVEFCLLSSPLNLVRGEQTTDLFSNVLTTETQNHNRTMSQLNSRERNSVSRPLERLRAKSLAPGIASYPTDFERNQGCERVGSVAETRAALQRTRVWISVPMSVGSQPPEPPAPKHHIPSSWPPYVPVCLSTHIHTQMHTL